MGRKRAAKETAPASNPVEAVGDRRYSYSTRRQYEKGFFVSLDYSSDALHETDRFFREDHRIIIPLTVRAILDEEIAKKLA